MSSAVKRRLVETVQACDMEFSNWRPHYQELATYILPRRYEWLAAQNALSTLQKQSDKNRAAKARNDKILDSTGTLALRTLAAGMLNGITSPSRPWLRLRQAGFSPSQSEPLEHRRYFDEVSSRMLTVMAETNFYSSMAILYLELAGFGTAALVIDEDFDDVFRCYNSPLGEFRLAQDSRRLVTTFIRILNLRVAQVVQQFGEENVSPRVLTAYKAGGLRLHEEVTVIHIIEPNDLGREESLPARYKFREFYFEMAEASSDKFLSRGAYEEAKGAFPRWELTGNDAYGTSPLMDALPDIIQLQQETLRKAQAIDKMVNPPVILESFMRGTPGSLLPGGKTYAPPNAAFGAKPVYTVSPPLGEMSADIAAIQTRIKKTCHNDLFLAISNLETVRTATEIDARWEERLVMLGAVLERFENEALDPVIRRVFAIMQRKGLLPEPPPDLQNKPIEVEYVSILSDAQRATGTASIERFAQFVGSLGSIYPDAFSIPDWDALIRNYADRLNVPAVGLKSREEVQQQIAAQQQLAQAREAALVGRDLTDAARNLSETDVGGGINALQMISGN